MSYLSGAIRTSLCAVGMFGGLSLAQDQPALTISPAKATMLVGDSRTFRAVGKDGRMRHPVRWSVSPEGAATLTLDGDEAVLQANETASTVVLTGHSGGDSADASIEIHSGTLAQGTQIWSVTATPGCKTGQITQAVPSASGPDLYVQENCPGGTIIRALTADGREMWRTGLGGSTAHSPRGPAAKEEAQPHERLNMTRDSVCAVIAPGMTKEKVSTFVDERGFHLGEEQRQSDSWTLEEEGFRCTILFDSRNGTVAKKKKTIVTE